jgi:hypothetical protein
MSNHLRLEVLGGVDSVMRIAARLHSLGANVEEMHLSGSELCLHLGPGASRHRVMTVLERLADVRVQSAPLTTTGIITIVEPWR